MCEALTLSSEKSAGKVLGKSLNLDGELWGFATKSLSVGLNEKGGVFKIFITVQVLNIK